MHLSNSRFKGGENARISGQLLIGRPFDVFIDSPQFHCSPPETTQFVETYWRRRESVPFAPRKPVSGLCPMTGARVRAASS